MKIETPRKIHIRKATTRYSGQKYENSKERLQQIKEKYKNGITYQMIKDML